MLTLHAVSDSMILDKFQLSGRNALVTGSSRGLGAAIALALAQAGANVGCHGKSDPGIGTSKKNPAVGTKKFLCRW
jgi:2-dehydro-3-deoxy-D-gluconate 5-dehydrogenase